MLFNSQAVRIRVKDVASVGTLRTKPSGYATPLRRQLLHFFSPTFGWFLYYKSEATTLVPEFPVKWNLMVCEMASKDSNWSVSLPLTIRMQSNDLSCNLRVRTLRVKS
jgi:hypothetical protein